MNDCNHNSMHTNVDKLFTLLRPTSSKSHPFSLHKNNLPILCFLMSHFHQHTNVISSILTRYKENLPQLHFSFRFCSFSLLIKKFLRRTDFTCGLQSFLIASWTNQPPPLPIILLFHKNSSVKVSNDWCPSYCWIQ